MSASRHGGRTTVYYEAEAQERMFGLFPLGLLLILLPSHCCACRPMTQASEKAGLSTELEREVP